MKPYFQDDKLTVYQGDCRIWMECNPSDTFHAVVTSPPYWPQRQYKGEPLKYDGWKGHLGLEPTPQKYVDHVTTILRKVKHILHPSGVLWFNIGDAYASRGGDLSKPRKINTGQARANLSMTPGTRTPPPGRKAKDMVGLPFMFFFAFLEDDWWVRQDVIWAKGVSGQAEMLEHIEEVVESVVPSTFVNRIMEQLELDFYVGNPMPGSAKDRPASSHEHIWMLTKREHYHYDWLASREPAVVEGKSRNSRSVWTLPTKGYKGAHFAVMSPHLARKCLVSSVSKKGCCSECGEPWKRIVERLGKHKVIPDGEWEEYAEELGVTGTEGRGGRLRAGLDWQTGEQKNPGYRTVGWEPGCKHDLDPIPCRVLDPFGGSGTTAIEAIKLGFHATMIELSEEYCELAVERYKDEVQQE